MKFVAGYVNALAYRLETLAGVLHRELRRLNSARIDAAVLATMKKSERVNAVKVALEAHHRDRHACC